MSVLAYPPTSDEEVFLRCTKDCGIVTATDDFQFFTLACKFCAEKFLYFDAFIGHMQTEHLDAVTQQIKNDNGVVVKSVEALTVTAAAAGSGAAAAPPLNGKRRRSDMEDERNNGRNNNNGSQHDDDDQLLPDDIPTSLLEPEMFIKHELDDNNCDDSNPEDNENLMVDEASAANYKQEQDAFNVPIVDIDENSYMDDNSDLDDSYAINDLDNGDDGSIPGHDEIDTAAINYDEMVEESLLGHESELTMHIKDRKMIQFLIDSYKRNPFLWDHRHSQFRDRIKRQRFLEWIVLEFKRRFNIALAKDAITRKWDNLRTVYKRECNRMSLERTNVSTLWYFQQLHFLNSLYSYNNQMTESVVRETSYRRRFSAIWSDVSTSSLLKLVKKHQCFYNRIDPDYRSKEKRGEALQLMSVELQPIIEVSTIQISKRLSQLRFDYSKQKFDRLNCELMGKKFLPTYTYYEAMQFMDDDVPPFKCQQCDAIVQSARDMDLHMQTHETVSDSLNCSICDMLFNTAEDFTAHNQIHIQTPHGGGGSSTESNYRCDLCTASFREQSNYEEHMRRHNDELLLPTLGLDPTSLPLIPDIGSTTPDANSSLLALQGLDIPKPYPCDICHRTFASQGHLNAHRVVHTDERDRRYRCDYPQCGKSFLLRQSLLEHVKMHYTDDEYKCDVCHKGFKSSKNLQNHKQIHDKVKRYICPICGSAFAQAAGLYLHKRRHNRPSDRLTGRTTL